MISPTYDIVNLGALFMLMLSSIEFRVAKIVIMPEFTPNAIMLEKHWDRGDEPWEIYAWCVRDAIAKYSGIQKLEEKLCLKDKLAYAELMNSNLDRVEINGQMFEYEGDHPIQEVRISSRALIKRRSTITYKILEEEPEEVSNQ